MSENSLAIPSLITLMVGECDQTVINLLKVALKREGYHIAGFASTAQSLERLLLETIPDVVLLGELQGANCFAVFRELRQAWPQLPVILISHQPVSDVFRNWVIQRGINDVIYSHPHDLDRLSKAILKGFIDGPLQATLAASTSNATLDADYNHDPLNYESVKIALEELSQISTEYFGPLAIGNYWRKTYKKALEKHPDLTVWDVDHQGHFSLNLEDNSPNFPPENQQLAVEQVEAIQAWINLFLDECGRILVNFPALIERANPSPLLVQLLPES